MLSEVICSQPGILCAGSGVATGMTTFSMLDLAVISPTESARVALQATVSGAQAAEASGYERVWYAEHHNMPAIASSATSVLIAHVAAHTSTIRLGAGGIMLPNHSPLTIAEQFGTLAELHPGRIDLGLGRAPGGDLNTLRALRRSPQDADTFPADVRELQGYLTGDTLIPGVHATPGRGTNVPLYILGSSLFGAKLAAVYGLPYAFASHFAPNALMDALEVYRREFVPSEQLDKPYAMVALNALVAEDEKKAQVMHRQVMRQRLKMMLRGGVSDSISELDLDRILDSPSGAQVQNMMKYSAVGTPTQARDYAEQFARETGADELIVAHLAAGLEDRVYSITEFGKAMA